MLKMEAILKSKMAAKREMTSNFLSTFIAIHDITNIGIAIILTSLWAQKLSCRPKYAANGGHFEIQYGRHGDG